MRNVIPVADFQRQNPTDWKTLLTQLFPFGRPERAVWTDQAAICAVLSHVGSIEASNYTFFPTTGGFDLTGCRAAAEPGLLELVFQYKPHTNIYYAKVASLQFESFGDADNYEWDYFRLKLAPLSSTNIGYQGSNNMYERITELTPGEYVSLDKWEYEDRDNLPATARPVTRLLQGSLVIFQKTSFYNSDISGATGEHNRYSADEFREEIARLRVQGGKHLTESEMLEAKEFGLPTM
jgi:hypothetical protein